MNARRDGLYSRHYSDDELGVLLNPSSDLTDEIALSRVLTSRLLAALGKTQDTAELVQLAQLCLRSTSTCARLLQANKVLTGEAADDLAGAIGGVLDQLSATWGVKL